MFINYFMYMKLVIRLLMQHIKIKNLIELLSRYHQVKTFWRMDLPYAPILFGTVGLWAVLRNAVIWCCYCWWSSQILCIFTCRRNSHKANLQSKHELKRKEENRQNKYKHNKKEGNLLYKNNYFEDKL